MATHCKGAETGGSLGLAGYHHNSRVSKRPCLRAITQRAIEQDFLLWPLWAHTHACSYTTPTSTQICSHTINNLPSSSISYSCSSLCLSCSGWSFILVFILGCCHWKLYYTQHNWPPVHFGPVTLHFDQKEIFALTMTPSPPRGYDHSVKIVFTCHIEFLSWTFNKSHDDLKMVPFQQGEVVGAPIVATRWERKSSCHWNGWISYKEHLLTWTY